MLCFLIHTRIACNAIQKALHELAAPGFKVQSVRKICAPQLLSNICISFLKGMCQCDTCDKHLPKLVRIIYKSAVNKKKHCGLPGSCRFLPK